jgi:hypothetical protein
MDKNKENVSTNPILVENPNKKNEFYNVAPFLTKSHFLNEENHFQFMTGIMKKCQRVVACANADELPIDDDDLKLLLYHLFELEIMFDKCTVVRV